MLLFKEAVGLVGHRARKIAGLAPCCRWHAYWYSRCVFQACLWVQRGGGGELRWSLSPPATLCLYCVSTCVKCLLVRVHTHTRAQQAHASTNATKPGRKPGLGLYQDTPTKTEALTTSEGLFTAASPSILVAGRHREHIATSTGHNRPIGHDDVASCHLIRKGAWYGQAGAHMILCKGTAGHTQH